MNSSNESTRNSEQRQYQVYLMPNGDWSSEPGDGTRYEPEVFFMAGGAIGIDIAGHIVVKDIEAWASRSQSSTLRQCKAWLSAVLRRMR